MKKILESLMIAMAFLFGMAVANQIHNAPTETVDMSEVTSWESSEYGLQLYFEDGTGYWLEK